MTGYGVEQLAQKALTSDPKCIGDRLYHLAWCFFEETNPGSRRFKSVEELYHFFLIHSDVFSLERARERYLDQHLDVKPRAESTEKLRRKLLNGEEALFHD